MTNEEWNTYFNGHWYFSGAKQDRHLAMFPEELPYRLIRMFSFPNETVLDPFTGSGTQRQPLLKSWAEIRSDTR
jgi:site-specific DNA-methyltransferase (adenine-specific)